MQEQYKLVAVRINKALRNGKRMQVKHIDSKEPVNVVGAYTLPNFLVLVGGDSEGIPKRKDDGSQVTYAIDVRFTFYVPAWNEIVAITNELEVKA